MANTISLYIKAVTGPAQKAMEDLTRSVNAVGEAGKRAQPGMDAAGAGSGKIGAEARDASIWLRLQEKGLLRTSGAAEEAGSAARRSGGRFRDMGDDAKRSAAGVESLNARLKTVSDSATVLSRRLALIGGAGAAAFGLLGRSAIKTAADMEQTRVAFGTLLKSSEAATTMLEELARFAVETPFDFPDVARGAKQLMAFGFSAQEVIPLLRDLGDATGALGIGSEGLQRLIFSLGQMMARGRITGEEIRELSHAGIPIMEILKEKIGATDEQMRKLGDSGITAAAALKAIREGIRERYGGGMEQQARTLGGIVTNLQESWTLLMSSPSGTGIGDYIAREVKPALEGLLKQLDALRDSGKMERFAREIGELYAAMAQKAGRALTFIAEHPALVVATVKWAALGTSVALVGAGVAKLISVFAGLAGAAIRAAPYVARVAGALAAMARHGTTIAILAWQIDGVRGVLMLLPRAIAAVTSGFMAALGPGGIAIAAIVGLKLAWERNLFDMQGAWTRFRNWVLDRPVVAKMVGAENWTDSYASVIKGQRERDRQIQKQLDDRTKTDAARAVYIARRLAGANALSTISGANDPAMDRLRQKASAEYDAILKAQAARKAIQVADTTGGRGGAAERHDGDRDRQKWLNEEIPALKREIEDYIRARWGKQAASAFAVSNVLKGAAHQRDKALDVVTRDPKRLSWAQLTEALHAAGLHVSDETTYEKMSPAAKRIYGRSGRGAHLHATLPSKGQQAAYSDMERAEKDAAKRVEDVAKQREADAKALREAEQRAARAREDARLSLLRSGHIADWRARFGLGDTLGPEADRLQGERIAKLAELDRSRQTAMIDAGSSAEARAAVNAAWVADRLKAWREYQDGMDALNKKRLDKERADEDRALEESRRRQEEALNIRRLSLDTRLEERRESGTLTQEDVQVVREYHANLATARYLAGDLYGMLQAVADGRRAVREVLRGVAEQARAEREVSRYEAEGIASDAARRGQLDEEHITAIAKILDQQVQALENEGRLTDARMARLQADRAIEALNETLADQQREAKIAALRLTIAEKQYHISWMANGREKVRMVRELIALQRQLAEAQGKWVPPGKTTEEAEQEAAAGDMWTAARARIEKLGALLRGTVEGFAEALASVLGGEKPGNAWKQFLSGLKRMFLRMLSELLAEWIIHEKLKTVVSKLEARKREQYEAGRGGTGGLGALIGSAVTGGNPIGGIIGGIIGGALGLSKAVLPPPSAPVVPALVGAGGVQNVVVNQTVNNLQPRPIAAYSRDLADRVQRATRGR